MRARPGTLKCWDVTVELHDSRRGGRLKKQKARLLTPEALPRVLDKPPCACAQPRHFNILYF